MSKKSTPSTSRSAGRRGRPVVPVTTAARGRTAGGKAPRGVSAGVSASGSRPAKPRQPMPADVAARYMAIAVAGTSQAQIRDRAIAISEARGDVPPRTWTHGTVWHVLHGKFRNDDVIQAFGELTGTGAELWPLPEASGAEALGGESPTSFEGEDLPHAAADAPAGDAPAAARPGKLATFAEIAAQIAPPPRELLAGYDDAPADDEVAP